MGMPLGEFRQDIVLQNMEDFRQDPNSLRKGFNAVSSVDAYAAHILNERMIAGGDPFEDLGAGRMGNRDDTHFRGVLAEMDPSFRILRDVAKANKHAFLERGNPQVNGSGDMRSARLGWCDAGVGEGVDGGGAQLIVQTLAGEQHSLLTILENSLQFLDQTSTGLGLLQ